MSSASRESGRDKYKASWRPEAFERYRELYPASPPLSQLACANVSEAYAEVWNDAALTHRLCEAREVAFVFVRGLFGAWIPRHLAQPLATLSRSGAAALIARSAGAGTIDANARALADDLALRVPPERRIVFLCHSKGGLDTLRMLSLFPALRARTRAVVLFQTPRGGCAVLESVVRRQHQASIDRSLRRAQERFACLAIVASGARDSCLELTSGGIERTIAETESAARSLPLLSVASWSDEPSLWLDTQHARLSQIRPGCAHDGLFFTEDLIWPFGEQIMLPRLDHSQPTVGGRGVDHGRLWLALSALALSRTQR